MVVRQKLRSYVVVGVGLTLFLLFSPLLISAANLLQNDGFEAPYLKYGEWSAQGHTFDLEVADDWQKFVIAADTDSSDKKPYFMRASALAFLFGFVEKRDGVESQIWWSTERFHAGVLQQVSGLTIGETYGFQAGILQMYANTFTTSHNKMFRSVGIDPGGGTDPTSPGVLWSPEEGRDVAWFYPGVGTVALSNTMTVFIKVRSIDDAPQFEENGVWVDDAFMDVAPTTSLSLTLNTPTQVTAIWQGTPRPGFHLFAYEAQYRKIGDANWTDLQIFASNIAPSTDTTDTFAIEPGATYMVRARTWHEQNGGDSHEVPGPWTEAVIETGGLVAGKILSNRGHHIGGATVSVENVPDLSTTSDESGGFSLLTGAGTFDLTASAGSSWSVPHPVRVVVPYLTSTVPLTLALRPADDMIFNGDFLQGLNGWQTNGTPPVINMADYRTVTASLQLTGNVTISQTGVVSGMYEPTLAFWYKFSGGDGDDLFTAEVLGDSTTELLGTTLTPSNSFSTTSAGGWRYAFLPLNITEVYTGPIGVRFSLSQTGPTPATVYLDEVSLGKAPGGPRKVYLPLIIGH